MRIAVAGGTGLVGELVVRALEAAGHVPVVIARATGVDVISGDGLDAALADVDAVIDVTNTPDTEREKAIAFFGTASQNLLAAEARAGVGHHIALTIAGADRIEHNGHYAGKRRQEELVQDGPIPYSLLPATQFYEFAELVLGWTTKDGRATIAPLLLQPVAASDVADVLVELASGPPRGRTRDLAGPDPHDFVDMTRRILDARGTHVRLVPSWQDGVLGLEFSGEVMLPEDGARIAPTSFETWLRRSS
jgi:uncharacterized protein YbjT (DUF2867 family)